MGTIGGKYEVFRKLGEGATSAVFLCYDPFAEREVAIKRIFPEILKDRKRRKQYRALLLNEASLAGKLIHPHIVQIFDAVIGDDESFIVMEYVPGGTLEPHGSPESLLPIQRVVEIAFKCTHALQYANRLGITHRDIKPANILLASVAKPAAAEGGEIKISDFGACIQTGGEQTQVSGVGSPAYMSPEQLREQGLTHQTDIYSLGVVMYQLLTGRLPFQASSDYAMIYQICNIEPDPPSAFRADLPPALDSIVMRAMRKDVALRYASWDEFAHDLAKAFRNQNLTAKQGEVPDSEKFEALRALGFFSDFSDIEIWEVIRFARWETAVAGTQLMRDGDSGDYFCIVLDGELEVLKDKHPLGRLLPGEIFGEIAVIDQRRPRRIADVVARADTRLAVIPGKGLRQASDACRMHFYQAFLLVLSQRLAQANIQLVHT